ncbi:MAG: ribbon-helix-helix domain-containing protein [bacterium]
MGRRTKVVGFSVPPDVAEDYERLAARQRTSKSELFRQMVETYKAKLEEEEFFRLQRRMARRTRRQGGLTEKDIERIVFEDR